MVPPGPKVLGVAAFAIAGASAGGGSGVRSGALGDFGAAVPAVASLTEPPEVLIVAVKATGLRASLARIAAPPSLVVPLLNGLDHMEVLRERFGAARVAA